MKRKQCLKDQHDNIVMTDKNIKICVSNQEESFQNLQLNQSLHLQYYGFTNIDNLHPFIKLNTLFLNNNIIQIIQNLDCLTELRTLNLSFNRIKQIKNIKHLVNLYTLDLSNNMIEQIKRQQLTGLSNLHNLKLSNNRISTYEGLFGIIAIQQSLTYLELSGNKTLFYNPLIYSQLFAKLKISVLSLQNTLFCRSVPSYRKETINVIKGLKFLDDRPVTEDERMLAQAWKIGGLEKERQMRSQLRQKKVQKQDKIYSQMQQRNRIVDQKRRRVLQKLTNKQSLCLKELLKLKNNQQQYQILDQDKKILLKYNIEDLDKYLLLMFQSVKHLDLNKELNDGKVELPKMIIDKETPEAIYVYNVTQEQIPLIAAKYYPDETRSIIAVNYQKESEVRWVKQYDQLLHATYEQARGNIDLLEPLFNLQVYDYDANTSRKVKRFEIDQLKQRLSAMQLQEGKRQRSIEALYQLD